MKTGLPVSVSYSISGPALIIVIIFAILVIGGAAFFIYKKLTVQKIEKDFKTEEVPEKIETLEEIKPEPTTVIDNQTYDAPTFDNEMPQSPVNIFEQPVMPQPLNPGFGPTEFDSASIPPQTTISNGLEPNVGIVPPTSNSQPQPYVDGNQNINQNDINNSTF